MRRAMERLSRVCSHLISTPVKRNLSAHNAAAVVERKGMLLLTRQDVMSVLKMKDCIDAMETAFRELNSGSSILPLRTPIKTADGISLFMPAYLKDMKALAIKVVTVFKQNPKNFKLPVILAKVLVMDPRTGDVICVMDGGYLTAMRTGAASGLATKLMARPDDNQVCVIFGAGVQGKAQLEAVAAVRKLSKAAVYDIFPESSKRFCKEMSSKLGFPVEVASDPNRAAAQADIICNATSSPTPVFDGSFVRPGTHINSIGSHTPAARELDLTVIKRSRLIVDTRQACLAEAGDIIIPIKEGRLSKDIMKAELGEVVLGKAMGRTNEREITIFKSNGLAVQDVAAARLVYDKAIQGGYGRFVPM